MAASSMNRRGNVVERVERQFTDKHFDNDQRRTKPEDNRPYSPKRIEAIYSEGKETISRKEWFHETHQANQAPEDHHQDNGRGRYDNDVPRDRWARGGDLGGDGRPHFDHGHFDQASKPPKPASGLKASGKDMTKSPFSSAYRKGSGEGF